MIKKKLDLNIFYWLGYFQKVIYLLYNMGFYILINKKKYCVVMLNVNINGFFYY